MVWDRYSAGVTVQDSESEVPDLEVHAKGCGGVPPDDGFKPF